MDKRFQSLGEKINAVSCLHNGPDGIGARKSFPLDLWKDLARKDLMGILIPHEYNGLGLDLDALASAIETLVICGSTMGFALSFMIHHLVAHHFIVTHGKRELKEIFLPRIARGEITAAVAASEPGIGAHPKYLKTHGEERDATFTINGSKSFITNGPMADLFIVLAITQKKDKRNLFSAFAIPKKTEGLCPGQPMDISILSPCPHSTLCLENCRISEKAITGERDKAWETMMIPFRRVEQVMATAIISGAMQNQAAGLAALLKGETLDKEIKTMEALASRASLITRNIVKNHMENSSQPISAAGDFSDCANDFMLHIQDLIKKTGDIPSPKQKEFHRDITALLRFFSP